MRRALLLLLLAAMAMAWWIFTADDGAAPAASTAAGASIEVHEAAAAKGQPQRVAAAPSMPATPDAAPLLRYPIERALAELTGCVRDDFEQPVANVAVSLQPELGGVHALLQIADDRTGPPATATNALGAFRFARVAVGPYRVSARASDGRTAHRSIAAIGDNEPVLLRLAGPDPDTTWRVIAVDAANNPVADARVQLHAVPDTEGIVAAGGAAARTATTGADGSCTFADAPAAALIVSAEAQGLHAIAAVPASRPNERQTTTLLLSPTGGIRGSLGGAAPAQLQGATMQALAMLYPGEAYYTGIGMRTDAAVVDATFAFPALPAGRYALHLQSPRGLRLALPAIRDVDNSVAPLVVEVRPLQTTEVTAEVAAGGSIDGTVRRTDGTPVEGALVTTVLVPRTSNFPAGFELQGASVWRLDSALSEAQVHPAAHARARSDANGHYALASLPPGRHRVAVFAAGLALAQRIDVAVDPDAPATLDFTLAAAGVLQGFLPGGSYLGARRTGSAQCSVLAILPDSGAFTFPGLAAGDYELGKPAADDMRQFVVMTTAHVDAGRTTWVDLRDAGAVRIAGVLLTAAGQPVQAALQLWSQRRTSRSDGSFEFRLHWPLRRWFEHPQLAVEVGGLRWQLPFPDAAIGARDWSGEFRLGGEALTVRLLDAEGTPLAGVLSLSGPQVLGERVPIGPGGRVDLQQLTAGEYHLGASARDAIVDAQVVQVPQQREVQLTAMASTVLDVLALDQHGRPRERAPVNAAVWRGEGPAPTDPQAYKSTWYSGTTGADGHARIVVPAGDVLVMTHVWDTDIGAQQLVRTLRAVPAAVTLQLPR